MKQVQIVIDHLGEVDSKSSEQKLNIKIIKAQIKNIQEEINACIEILTKNGIRCM